MFGCRRMPWAGPLHAPGSTMRSLRLGRLPAPQDCDLRSTLREGGILDLEQKDELVQKILVISPGVLPVPPVMGGAVENLIARLQGELQDAYEFHHASVAPPSSHKKPDRRVTKAHIHTIESISPLKDFRPDNHFELQESDKWSDYAAFCRATAKRVEPDIIHIHNEVRLALAVAEAVPGKPILVHVNDEVVTRLDAHELRAVSQAVDLLLSCSRYIHSQIDKTFEAHDVMPPKHEIFYNFVDLEEFDPASIEPSALQGLRERYG